MNDYDPRAFLPAALPCRICDSAPTLDARQLLEIVLADLDASNRLLAACHVAAAIEELSRPSRTRCPVQ